MTPTPIEALRSVLADLDAGLCIVSGSRSHKLLSAAIAHPVAQEAQAQAVPASPTMSSIDAAQRRGYLGEPEDWREACRLFRARCTPDDASKMAKLRTYIEDGLLVVVRPDRLAAQSVPVAHPAAGWKMVPMIPTVAMLSAMAECDGYAPDDRDRPGLMRWEDYWLSGFAAAPPAETAEKGGGEMAQSE